MLGGVLDFAVTLPTAVVGGPQAPLLLSATSSAGQAAADAAEQGMGADQALVRGALSGVATYAFSKAPTEQLFKLGSQPLPAGKLPAFQTVLSNSAKQGLSEGIEESGEYLFNVAADKAAGVDTPFSVQELAANAGAGALGGFVMGAGASGVGALSNRTKTVNKPGTLPETDGMETMQGSDTYAAEKDFVFDEMETQERSESKVNTKAQDAETQIEKLPKVEIMPFHVGEATKIYYPYEGKTPVNREVFTGKSTLEISQNVLVQAKKEIAAASKTDAFAKKIKSTLRNIFEQAGGQRKVQIKGVTYNQRPYEVSINGNATAKIASDPHMTAEKLAVFYYLDDAIETATYVGSGSYGKNKRKKGDVIRYDYFEKPIQIESNPYVMTFDVEVYHDRNNFRTYRVINKIDLIPAAASHRTHTGGLTAAKSDLSSNNIAQATVDVNERITGIEKKVNPSEQPLDISAEMGVEKHSFGENTVGSAEYDPNSLQALADKYGYVPTGGGPKSGIAIVPKAIDDSGKKTRTFARTAIEAIGTSPETVKQIENDILSGKYGYTPGTNQELVKKVGNKISNNGFDRSYQMWQGVVHGNSRIKRDDIMLGTYLAMIADKNGNTKLASEIYADMAAIGTEQGQTVQAFSILKKMGAPAQMRYIDTIVERLNNQKRQQNSPIVIDEELRTELLNAKGQEEIDAVVDKMKDNIASQINTSWMDKLTAWRYMSMLGNPRTHIRNILGNAAFRVAVGIKNIIGTGLEAGVSKIPGVEFERTKSLLTPNDKPLVDYAKRVFDEETTGGSKYNDKNDIENRKNVFKTKALEKARRGIFNSLEAEDKIFRKNAFSRSMAGYLKANGVTPENINSFENIGLVNRAKAYAEQEALKTTFQDASMVADVLNSIKKVHPGLDFFVSGVQPFLRTPINIAKRGIEYSPVGLLNGGKDLAKALKKGYSPAEALDEMAAGLTGTGIMALGAWLSDIGVLNAGREDQEKLAAMDDATGVQEYSLVIPGVGSYTIDWLAPAVMPLFVGAELYQTMTDEGATMEDVLGTITRITEPMLQMSMMSSLDSALRSAVYSSDNVGAGVLQVAAKSYLGQYIPTVAGQVARTIDDTRRTSYVEPGAQFPNVESFLQQQQAKIPGLSQNLPPRLNVWGEEDVDDNFGIRLFQNMFSPGYWENDTSTDVERTLESIYRETGDVGTLPRYAPKEFSLPNGTKKTLSSEEYTAFSKDFGQENNQLLSDVMEDNDFNSMEPEMQAAIINDIYQYSLDIAKDELMDYGYLSADSEAARLLDSGFPISDYFITKAKLDVFEGEGSTQQKRDALFAMDGMSGEEKNEFAKLYFDSEKEIDYSNADTYAMTQLSDAGQNKYNRVESLGYSVQKYAELYPIAAASEKKAIVISNLMAAGLTEAQAMEFYRRIKKQDWDE